MIVTITTRLGSKQKKWSKETKKFAILLRKRGLTYGEITTQLKVSKSTLFTWISKIKRPVLETKLEHEAHMKRIQGLAVLANRKRRTDRLEEIRRNVQGEVDKYNVNNKDYLRSLLSMLYWAEGSKGRGRVTFANTDPVLSVLFITLLRKSYEIDEEKLHVRLHLHYYHKIKESRKIWSELLKIPESKFGKIYIKKRSKTKKFRQNFAGICFIKYYSESLRFEILERARQISQKIVPVA
jgi:transposase-like protein